MDQKRVTLIVSDLHMGDGSAGDDFVDNDRQFARFVRAQIDTREGRDGQIELIINGDFLEFVQTLPEAYQGDSTFWCSETESSAKLDSILAGHPDVFDALAEFQAGGNQVTLFPGNHDVDLHWPDVQTKLKHRIPGLNIETQCVTYLRYDGRLHVSHGHLFPSIDPANGFEHWDKPIRDDVNPPRLEMCPGTLFVIKFVNLLEARYPFADNLHPETALAGILAKGDRWGLLAVSWLLVRFAARYRQAFLSSEARSTEIGAQLLNAVQTDAFLREKIAGLYADVLKESGMTEAVVKETMSSEDAIAAFIERLLGADAPWDRWLTVLDMSKPGVLGIGDTGGNTLSITAAGNVDVKAGCILIAEGRWKIDAQIVVLGHTHLPQDITRNDRRYYNPGSWTRYVDDASSLTLDQLKDESKFPYQLNYVRVEDTGGAALKSEMINFERVP